jgi:putative peptidoglycan lipid II flippase
MWWFNLGHVGLALATSVSAWLNAMLLFRGLRRDAVLPENLLLIKWIMQIGVASAAMIVVLLWMMPEGALWAGWSWWQRASQLGVLCVSGLVVFAASLLLSGVRAADLRR